jgi:uroporphyrin-III C-methyltransferase/precorrin-2 dehydrogenase/sirohydrochlorin ferrochelatase
MSTRVPTDTKRGRLQPLARLPVFYALDGKRVVLAGGTQAAAWKAELLSAAGAQVDVYADEISDDMLMLLADPPRGVIVHHQHTWTPDDFRRAAMAIGTFENDDDAKKFAAAARAAGVPVNVIDKPAFCDFSFGAIVNRSPLVIGVSTDGAAPVFAQAIRAKLEAMLPKGFAAWAKAASTWRAAVQASGLTFAGRRGFWQRFTAQAIQSPERAPTQTDFDRFLADVTAGPSPDNGSVTLVGAGPGDAELLTLRAVRALQSADVILFDDLVSAEVLDFARREARKMLVGKTGFGPSCKQEDINALMVSLAKQGKRVVRLKGGDPLIFARAGEELAACRSAGVAVEVVPGITAAQGAAAKLGLPLTGRSHAARRLQYVTGHARDGKLPDDIDLKALADAATTTAIYMPARTLAALVERAIAAGLDPQTPALAVARATRPDQQMIAASISELPAKLTLANMPGPLLVMIGQVLEAAAEQGGEVAAPVRETTFA